MAAPNDKPKEKEHAEPVAGGAVYVGELGGDGVTPKAEWDEKYKEIKKKQDEHDEKMRQRAREDAGVLITTEKVKHG